MRGWWLATQPRPVRVYVPAAVAAGVLLTIYATVAVGTFDPDVLLRALAWTALAITTSLVLRRRVLGVPVEQAAQNLSGVWGLSALLIWGWSEAFIVAALVSSLWEELSRRRWEGQAKPHAQVALDCSAELGSLALAALVLSHTDGGWTGHLVTVTTYLVADCVLVLTAVCMATRVSPHVFLMSWTTMVMVLTEATVSIGMAAAWRTSPMAAIGLAWSVVAANAGMHYMRLHEMASTDSRTGLMTAQTWRHATVRSLTRGPVAILMADLDHFKRLNDTRGHLVGDEILGKVGRVVQETLRIGDLACRWGGEEFTVALPGMAAQQAVQVAERLRREVARATEGSSPVTISIGVSVAPLSPMDDADDVLEDALRAADRAMYEAKAGGRDRVAVAGAANLAGDTRPSSPDGMHLPPPDDTVGRVAGT
jgi:diguanylate cyclase (GGDEF)-like protein